jgi:hypothetical protein
MNPRLIGLVLGAGLVACGPEYAYVPTTNAEVVGNRVAADYQIPESAPRGEVQLESYGFAEASPTEQPGEHMRTLHLRVIVIDNSAANWTFDTRAQRVQIDDVGAVAPVFASASSGATPPLVVIPPNGKRVVDLFFPLPATMQRAENISGFDAIWRVTTDQGTVAQRTAFDRVEVELPEADYSSYWDYGPGYYWGAPYWYNPYYYDYPVVGGYHIGPHYFGHPVGIHRFGGHFEPHGFHGGGFHGGGFHGGGHR